MESRQFIEMGSTSTSLLERVKSNEQDAWWRLTELYGPLIYSWCRRSRLSPEDAADLMQDVFRSVVIHISSFDPNIENGSFRGWLWTITRNKVRDRVKTRLSKTQGQGGDDAFKFLNQVADRNLMDDLSSSSNDLPDGLAYRAMKIIRNEVHETTWIAFWRTAIDDVAPAVVAEELGISVHCVWQAKSRVLRRARQLLEI